MFLTFILSKDFKFFYLITKKENDFLESLYVLCYMYYVILKADYRRSEISFKKMLSNISHDIKTPMTFLLGYLEIMRINGEITNEMLRKVE